jgi:hypothetical protein
MNDKRHENGRLGVVQGPLKLREALKEFIGGVLTSSKLKVISVDVADSEEGVQERVPPKSEPKVPTKGPVGPRNAVSVSCQLWIAWG